MKKILMLMLLSVFAGMLVGCEPEPLETLEEAEVVDIWSGEDRVGNYGNYISVEKNNQIINLKVYRNDFNSMTIGLVVSGTIYDTGYLDDITFPKLNVDRNNK